jgi:hypothetical protein
MHAAQEPKIKPVTKAFCYGEKSIATQEIHLIMCM